MRHEAAEIPTHDAVPCCACTRVELTHNSQISKCKLVHLLRSETGYLFLNVLGNILLNTVFLHGIRGNLDGLLLHLLALGDC